MKVLELSPYYYPEKISSSHLSDDLAEAFANAGFEIEVYSPTPTRGITEEVYREYKNKPVEELKNGKIKVYRFKMFREGRNPIVRAARYILVNLIQYSKGKRAKGVDVVFGASTPPTQGVLCALVAKKLSKKNKKKVPFVYNLQDVFPDSLVNAGMTSENSLIWKIGRKIEDFTYKNADIIIVISEDIKNNILKKGVPAGKIRVIRNWVDTESVKPVAKSENSLIKELGLNADTFKTVYAGNLGKAQGIGMLAQAAKLMSGERDTEFVVFGDGAEKETLEREIKENSLDNIKLFPLQPPEKIAQVYSLGDVCVVACKKGTGKGAFPSKTVSVMAAGSPVLAAFDNDSELCKIVKEYGIGEVCEPENAEEFVKALKSLKADRDKLRQMGEKARELALARFSKEQCTALYVEAINDACKK